MFINFGVTITEQREITNNAEGKYKTFKISISRNISSKIFKGFLPNCCSPQLSMGRTNVGEGN